MKSPSSKKWKLFVYNAVITRKVLYGLETLEPTQSASRLLSAFQLRGLRKKRSATYYLLHARMPRDTVQEDKTLDEKD